VQAGDWFVRQQSGPLGAEESAAFLGWLRASPIHIDEYLGVARVAQVLRESVGGHQPTAGDLVTTAACADSTVVPLTGPTASAIARERRFVRARVARLAASALLAAAAVVWWKHDGELLGIPKTYRTEHGEQRTQLLPDGSILRLDTDSAVTVHYSRHERLVEVGAGQAMFEVAHGDKSRWFRVAAGRTGAIAVGTRFNVYCQQQSTEFTVAEGEIGVYDGKPPELGSGEGIPMELKWRVPAGHRVSIGARPGTAEVVTVDLRQALGWLQHQIVFEHRPLGDVAAEFNRYARTPVDVEDAHLAALPISGAFDASDTQSFLAYVERLPGAKLQRLETRTRVLGDPGSKSN
jgi:transmembrane sensor